MKFSKQILVACTLAIASASVASAAAPSNEVLITGSTAYRGQTTTAIKNILNSGYVYLYSGSTAGGENAAVFQGTLKSNNAPVYVATSWSGSAAGIQTVAGNFAAKFIPLSKLSGLSGSVGGAVDPTSSSATAADIDSESGVHLAMSDVFQVTTPFRGTFNGVAYTSLVDVKVGVVPFNFVISPLPVGYGITDVRAQSARNVFTQGSTTGDIFTGVAADNAVTIYAAGRNADSGTRLTFQAEIGGDVAPGKALNQWAPADATGTPLQGAGAAAGGIVQYPAGTVNGISYGIGDNGYTSGGNLAKAISGATGLPASTYFLTYLSRGDTTTAIAGANGAKQLTYNGIADTDANITSGQYTFWGYEHLDSVPLASLTADQAAVRTALITNITNVTASFFLSNLTYNRASDGGTIE